MCSILSSFGQIIYGAIMLGCTVLTAVALFTPGWTQIKGTNNFYSKGEGIMPWTCAEFQPNDGCKEWWKTIPNWQHVVILCMWIALIFEIFCLVWNLLVFCTCFFKKCMIHPIAPLAGVVTILLAIAVIVYGCNGKEFVAYGHADDVTPPTHAGKLGYSFWLAVVALILAAADTVIGLVIVCFGQAGL